MSQGRVTQRSSPPALASGPGKERAEALQFAHPALEWEALQLPCDKTVFSKPRGMSCAPLPSLEACCCSHGLRRPDRQRPAGRCQKKNHKDDVNRPVITCPDRESQTAFLGGEHKLSPRLELQQGCAAASSAGTVVGCAMARMADCASGGWQTDRQAGCCPQPRGACWARPRRPANRVERGWERRLGSNAYPLTVDDRPMLAQTGQAEDFPTPLLLLLLLLLLFGCPSGWLHEMLKASGLCQALVRAQHQSQATCHLPYAVAGLGKGG